MFEDSKANTSVFLLLELACIQLCKVSFATRQGHHVQKKPPPNELYERFIYNTMVWGMFTFAFSSLMTVNVVKMYILILVLQHDFCTQKYLQCLCH